MISVQTFKHSSFESFDWLPLITAISCCYLTVIFKKDGCQILMSLNIQALKFALNILIPAKGHRSVLNEGRFQEPGIWHKGS